jgi:nitroreductase
MDFFEVVRMRRSVRVFTEEPVSDEQLQRVLVAMNRAPSAGNLQAYEVYLVRGGEQRTALAKAAGDQTFLAEAPLVMVFCAHGSRARDRYAKRGLELYCVQDATIACTFAMLAATALGLSSVWVGAFDEGTVASIVGAPRGQRPISMLPVGHGAEAPARSDRRDLTGLVHEVP